MGRTVLTKSHGSLDTLSQEARSERMSRVRSVNTRPEMRVRRIVHGLGYRYRLHARDLPGAPDMVFRSTKKAIFVHGCFWHRHPGCPRDRIPKSPERRAFWESKLQGNVVRDRRNLENLEQDGWRVLVIWECESEDPAFVEERVRSFLG